MAASESDSLEKPDGRKGKVFFWILALSVGVILIILSMSGRNVNYKKDYSGNCAEEFEIPLFDLSTIMKATNNFSIDQKIGEGALDLFTRTSTQGESEFKNEVLYIASLQHRNLGKILGCCSDGEEKLLIYGYLPSGNLDSFIFDETQRKVLDWPKRFHIINGIARGLMYLHQDSQLRIIHGDLKANNILLDKDMNPKISDFGLAKICEEDEVGAMTNRVVGTSIGNCEWEKQQKFSHPDHNLNLLGHAWKLYKEGRSIELLDECLDDFCSTSEAVRSISVGLLCVQQCPEDRLSISSAVLMLNNEGMLPLAKHPGFYIEGNAPSEIPITILAAR
ncbi:unnamed protein product [Withania somnifera]